LNDPRSTLNARQYGWLTLAYFALAVYGSLVPFHYRALPWDEAVARFAQVCQSPVQVKSRSDWAANVLLFLPLGFLLMASLCVDRRWSAGLIAALIVVPFCTLLSAAIEFSQLFFPPRVSSLNDVVAESLGGLMGTLTWLATGQRLTHWARGVWTGWGTRGMAARLLPGYLALLVLLNVLPLDLTISPVELYHKYREGRIVLVPFTTPHIGILEACAKQCWNVACFLPVGLLLAGLPGHTWQSGRGWPLVLGIGLAVAGSVEVLQLFVYSRFCDATDVVTGTLAVLAGWAAVHVGRAWQAAPAGVTHEPVLWYPAFRPVLLAAWLGLLILVNWQPFDFNPDGAKALARWHRVALVPFKDYFWNSYLSAAEQFLHKTLLFFLLGALLTPPRPAPGWRTGVLVLVSAALLAVTLEAGQLFLPSRYASVTDVLVETFGATLGFVLASKCHSALQARSTVNGRHREFCR
jgi:VanZ family protein